MKLWTTVPLDRLPAVLKDGFDNPLSDEILFWNNIRVGAENALSFGDELAFIEAEIPDDQLEAYFSLCIGQIGDEITDTQSQIDYMNEEGEDAGELERDLQVMTQIETAKESFDFFGYACLSETLPPSMLKLLDLEKTREAVESGNIENVASALETAEATPFKSLSAAFWVWLIFLIREIFGPGYGLPETGEGSAEEEEERIERMRQTAAAQARKRPRKKKKRS